jgi:hypothetical protein
MKKSLSLCFCILVVGLFALSCGGGGDDGGSASPSGPTVTPPSQNIKGTYAFRAIRGKYSDGTTFTEINYSSINGELAIGEGWMEQYMVVNGQVHDDLALFTISYVNGTVEGFFHVTTRTRTYDLSFAIASNYLTTYTGAISAGDGRTVEQWVTWEKTTDEIKFRSQP